MLAAMVAVLCAWVWLAKRGRAPAPAPTLLDVIPGDAILIAVVDVAQLRQTEVGRGILGEGRTVAGLGQVKTLCGHDPMDAVEQLAVAVPSSGIDGGFGIFASGRFDARALMQCAERIVRERGGRPVSEARGRFVVMHDASLDSASAELAVAPGGPLLLAEPAYVRASIDAAPVPRDADPHERLRAQVEPGVVVATVVLSAELRRTLAEELIAQRQGESPFRAVSSAALSLRVDAGPTRAGAHAHAVLTCDDAQACSAIAKLLDTVRAEAAGSIEARATGADQMLEALRIEAVETEVHLRVSTALADLGALVQRLVALRRLAAQPPPPEEPDDPRPPVPADAGIRVQADPAPSASGGPTTTE